MKLRLVLSLSFFILTSGLALASSIVNSDQDDKNKPRNSSGEKHGRWVYFGKDRPEEGYPEEGKIEEGEYKNDRKEGQWIKYYNDGVTPKLKGVYKNNRPEGDYEKINSKGIVIEKGTFVKGKYLDTLTRWHDDGSLKYKGVHNENGNEEGTVKFFYPNGQVEFEYTAKNGVASGKAVRYWENGDIKEVIYYGANGIVEKSEYHEMVSPAVVVKDPGASREKPPVIPQPRTKGAKFQPNGYNKVYNTNDEIWQDGEFRNGTLWDGKVYEYDRDGILLKVKVFKEGFYHSDGQL